MIGIYKITSPSKKVYIGQSINIEKRFKYYKRGDCVKQVRLLASFKKYGVDKHEFDIICGCEMSQLNEKERYYQDLYSVIENNGLNCRLTKSSDRSGKSSEETCNKLKKPRKEKSEEHRINLSKSLKGRTVWNKGIKYTEEQVNNMSPKMKRKGSTHKTSEETKRKISETLKGVKHTEERINKMRESKKGKASWNKGKTLKKHSNDTKIKMSESQKIRWSKKLLL